MSSILDPLEQLARRLDELEWYLREVHQITPAQIRDLRNRKERREKAPIPPDPADLD